MYKNTGLTTIQYGEVNRSGSDGQWKNSLSLTAPKRRGHGHTKHGHTMQDHTGEGKDEARQAKAGTGLARAGSEAYLSPGSQQVPGPGRLGQGAVSRGLRCESPLGKGPGCGLWTGRFAYKRLSSEPVIYQVGTGQPRKGSVSRVSNNPRCQSLRKHRNKQAQLIHHVSQPGGGSSLPVGRCILANDKGPENL